MPRSAGVVIPNREISSKAGNVININVAGGSTQTSGGGSEPKLKEFARTLSVMVDQRMMDARRPGGLLA